MESKSIVHFNIYLMSYRDIGDSYKRIHGKTISTCAIADALRKLGYPVKQSSNRINPRRIQKPCTAEELTRVRRILH